MTDVKPNKNLGQHWLRDMGVLTEIAACAKIEGGTVLEIGPGLGFLTSVLLGQADKVVAVEFDRDLAKELSKTLPPTRDFRLSSQGKSLTPRRNCGRSRKEFSTTNIPELDIINADFLQFDLDQLPQNYKVVANIPYYITNKIIMKLLTAANRPEVAVLLVQKEVAERLAAGPGQMSILAVAAQLYAEVELGPIVPAALFDPPPKVDSQVVILKPFEGATSAKIAKKNEKLLLRVVKAGFSARRKKLRSSLAGGLGLSKSEAENLLKKAHIDPNLRAQDLTIDDWYSIMSSIDA